MKRVKKVKRLFAVVLCVLTALSCMPNAAFASTVTGGSATNDYSMTEDFSKLFNIGHGTSGNGWYHNSSLKNGATVVVASDPNDSSNGVMKIELPVSTDNTPQGSVFYKFDGALLKGFAKFGFKIKLAPKTDGDYNGTYKATFAGKDCFILSGGKDTTYGSNDFDKTGWLNAEVDIDLDNKTIISSKVGENVHNLNRKFTDNAGYFRFYCSGSGMDVYIDDVYVQQIYSEVELVSSSVKDGEYDVPVNALLNLEFSDEIDPETLAGITLKKGTEIVPLTYKKNGKTVDLQHDTLEPASVYTLTLPTTLKSAKGEFYPSQEKTITFITGSGKKANVIDFEGFTADDNATVGTLMKAIRDKSGIVAKYGMNGGSVRVSTPADDNHVNAHWGKDSSKDLIMDGTKNYVKVINGELAANYSKDLPDGITSYDTRYIYLFTPGEETINSGIVHFKVDFENDTLAKKDFTKEVIALGGCGQIGFHAGYLVYGSSDGAWNKYRFNKEKFTEGKHSFDILMDLDAKRLSFTVDGKVITNSDETVKSDSLPLNENGKLQSIYLRQNGSADFDVLIKLDNISFEHYSSPGVVETAVVPVGGAAEINFDVAVKSIGAASLSDGSNNAEFKGELISNGYGYKITDFDPSKTYTLTLGNIITQSGVLMADQTVTVNAAAQENEFSLVSYSLSEVEAGKKCVVNATFKNGSAELVNLWIGVAFYDETDTLKAVGSASKGFAKNEQAQVAAELAIPKNATSGSYVKIFAWDGTSLAPLAEIPGMTLTE